MKNNLKIEQVFKKLISVLNNVKMDYLVDGGMAVNCYGMVRSTLDIDILVEDHEKKIRELLKRLKRAGFRVDLPSIEKILKITNIIHVYDSLEIFRIDIWLAKTAREKHNLSRKKKIKISNQMVSIVSAEDLIITKLLSGRERDLNDILGIVERKRAVLDKKYLRENAKIAGVTAGLKKFLR